MLIHLSKSITYAIHALYYMGYYMKDRPVMARELTDAFDFPYDSMLKILRQLAKDKILMSHRGSKGGFTLRMELGEISLFQVIESVEGPIEIVDPLPLDAGDKQIRKTTNNVMIEVTEKYSEMLRKINCFDLFKEHDPEQDSWVKYLKKEDAVAILDDIVQDK